MQPGAPHPHHLDIAPQTPPPADAFMQSVPEEAMPPSLHAVPEAQAVSPAELDRQRRLQEARETIEATHIALAEAALRDSTDHQQAA